MHEKPSNVSLLEQRLLHLLDIFTIEEILEMCDITEYDVLEILYMGGHIDLPPFIEEVETYHELDDETNG